MGGRVFSHPAQARDYAQAKGLPASEIKRWFRELDGSLNLRRA